MSTPPPPPGAAAERAASPDVRWSGLTHIGRVRPNNEDVFLALAVDGHEVRYLGKTGRASLGASDFVFAVSDGMGGAKSGEFASRITVDRVTRLFPRAFRLSAAGMGMGFADVLGELINQIHDDLSRLGRSYEECAGMGATLSLAWVTPEWLYFAHLGDSRIYYLPLDGTLTQVTHDHSHVGWLRRNGTPTSERAKMTEYFERFDDYVLVTTIIEDPVYLSEPFVRTTEYEMSVRPVPVLGYPFTRNDGPTFYRCFPSEETIAEKGYVPHNLPGENTLLDDFAQKHGIPRWVTPMANPPTILITRMMMPAIASPLTNLLAPSIEP